MFHSPSNNNEDDNNNTPKNDNMTSSTEEKNLINSNDIKLNCARIGCCNRYYLQFPKDNHKYYYNSNKSISIILQNKI